MEKKRKGLKVTLDQQADRSGICWKSLTNTFINTFYKICQATITGMHFFIFNTLVLKCTLVVFSYLPVGENKNDHKSRKDWPNKSPAIWERRIIAYMITSIQKALAKQGDNLLSASSIHRKQSNELHLLLSKFRWVAGKYFVTVRKAQPCNKFLGEILKSLISEVCRNKLNKQLL